MYQYWYTRAYYSCTVHVQYVLVYWYYSCTDYRYCTSAVEMRLTVLNSD